MTHTTRLYFEAHITVKPTKTTCDWSHFVLASESHGFRASRFDVDEVDHYDGAWFLSYRSKNYDETLQKIKREVIELKASGFKFIRAKIKDTLFDTKHGDVL